MRNHSSIIAASFGLPNRRKMAKMPYELRQGYVKNCEKQIAHFWHLESSLRDVTHIILKLRT